jgi:heat shock protein HslJ/uncharacterized lipoprotein YbaY
MPYTRTRSLLLAAGLLAGGCTLPGVNEPSSPAADADLVISGQLHYRQRIALPADSVAIIGLTTSERVITEQHILLDGRQVPVPFTLHVRRGDLATGVDHQLRGAIHSGGRPAWVTEPLPVDVSAARLDAGMLALTPYRLQGFASALRCGDRQVEVGLDGDDLVLSVDGEAHRLGPIPSASGARYATAGEPHVGFWNKGESNLLEIDGQVLTCVDASADADETAPAAPPANSTAAPYRARGNEPGWLVTITPGLCTDTMTGMPYPDTVTLTFKGQSYAGCGGDPATLLQGAEWVVDDIDGGGIIDRSRVTIQFGDDGRVSGRSGCNQYSGPYRVGGESLEITDLAGTLMACVPALNEQEGRFLQILADARTFALDATGTLVLRTGDGRTLTARRN